MKEVWYIEIMKRVLLFLIMLIMVLPVQCETLKGGVVYTVESAREEAFRGIEYQISMEPYKKYMTDPGYTPAKGNRKAKIKKRGRDITFFDDGSYGVVRGNISYYYKPNGKLEAIEITPEGSYPKLTKVYDINGNLDSITYYINGSDSFVYDKDKSFNGKWLGNEFYNASGQLKIKRF